MRRRTRDWFWIQTHPDAEGSVVSESCVKPPECAMLMFELMLVLLLAAVLLTVLAERIAVPYPSVLAIAGEGLAFLQFGPRITIDPDLALALFVAQALLDAAFDTSPRDLR